MQVSLLSFAFLLLSAGAVLTARMPHVPKPPKPPRPPSQVVSQPISPTSIKLSWKGSAKTDRYVIRVGSTPALTSVRQIVTTKPTAIVTDLKAVARGVDGFYRVDAYRGSSVASSRTGTFSLKPGVIAKPKVKRVSTSGVRLTWPTVANARQYDVVIARDKSFKDDPEAVRTVAADAKFSSDSLAPDRKYFVKIRPVNGSVLGLFSAPIAFRTPAVATTFNIGTWNVCSEKCSGYAGRARIGARFFNDQQIDIFGLQESGGKRVGQTTNAIWSGGARGFVRATGGAKARYIFFRPALFNQVSGGNFSIGDGRDATWAHLRTKDGARDFYYVDVHLENGHGNDGKRAREMRVLLAQMASINSGNDPIIYAGDFNSGKHRSSDSPGLLMRAAGMVDTVDVSTSRPINAHINSGHTFSTAVLASGDYVDHIFVSKDFKVLAWEQLVRISGNRYIKPLVSDHNALKSTVTLTDDNPTSGDIGEPTVTTPIPSSDLPLR